MSTRACYIFQDNSGKYAVYNHYDGYPEGAARAINNALALAWELPRFEPDEFAASFVAANKNGSGGVRLLQGSDLTHMPGDIEFLYIVRNTSNNEMNARIEVTGYSVNFWDAKTEQERQAAMSQLFTCSLDELENKAKEAA